MNIISFDMPETCPECHQPITGIAAGEAHSYPYENRVTATASPCRHQVEMHRVETPAQPHLTSA